MEQFTHHLAVEHSLADGMPRLIMRRNSLFLATPQGEVWQVFDGDTTDWMDGGLPCNNPDVLERVFVRAASGGRMARIYRFAIGESRSVTAWQLLAQFERAPIGDRALS
jgi:hypothetical protein